MLALEQMQFWHWSLSPWEEKMLMLSFVSTAPHWAPATPGRFHPVKPQPLGRTLWLGTHSCAAFGFCNFLTSSASYPPLTVWVNRGSWRYLSKTGGCKCTDSWSCSSPAHPPRTQASSCQGTGKVTYLCQNFPRSSVSQPRCYGLLQASYPHSKSRQ